MLDKKVLSLDELAFKVAREIRSGNVVAVGHGMADVIGKRLSSAPDAWIIDGYGGLISTHGASNSSKDNKAFCVYHCQPLLDKISFLPINL